MVKEIGFDNEEYLRMQSERIRERINRFDNKLYLEFGGKLFDDFHAARVLPGFKADSKLQMLLTMADQAEIVMVVSAEDIEHSKEREDLGITYGSDVLRLIDVYRNKGLFVGSVVITKYINTHSVQRLEDKLVTSGLRVYHHYLIPGYPTNVPFVISDEGYGKNDYIETERPLVVVTAPGPGSGKMATCLSQLYHDHKNGIRAGYAKFETFPVWNVPLKHPINLAYEAATADLNDMNMIDPYHLEAYGITAVNYNRDIEIFPVLQAMFREIYGESPYKSPTDMGVNQIGNCITDEEVCSVAAKQEIIRRYFASACSVLQGLSDPSELRKIEVIMNSIGLSTADRPVVAAANQRAEETNEPAVALQLSDGRIITGKTTALLGACSACLMNSMKALAGIRKKTLLIPKSIIEPIQHLKIEHLGNRNPRLHTDELLIALSVCAVTNPLVAEAIDQLKELRGCEAHSSVILSHEDEELFKRLGVNITFEPHYQTEKLFRG